MIIAIDPGPEESAIVCYVESASVGYECGQPIEWSIGPNEYIRREIIDMASRYDDATTLAIEYTPPYSLQTTSGRHYVPNQVALTAIEIGRFVQLWSVYERPAVLVSRMDVKKHLLGRATGNDAAITQAILARYGGTRENAVGKKTSPGPLYGLKRDLWSALAVAITWDETGYLKAKAVI